MVMASARSWCGDVPAPVAYAAALVGDQEVLRLTGPATVSERGPTLVLGPGTGSFLVIAFVSITAAAVRARL